MEYDRTKLVYVDKPEQIWVRHFEDEARDAFVSQEAADAANADDSYYHVTQVTLHRPSLQPIYGGPTLLEALWSEMDSIMERLMTGQDAEGDKFKAQELAWVLAIVTNAYAPSMDNIRAEAVRRWNAAEAEAEAEAEADAQEEALNPDQDDAMTRPEGADR